MNASEPTKRWIALIEIEAESVLPAGASPFLYRDPHNRFSVQLTNRAVRPLAEIPLLEMQLQFAAPDIATADTQVGPIAREFLYWLSFVTHSGFRMRHVERLIDWTPGLTTRDQYAYHADLTEMPDDFIRPGLADTLTFFNLAPCPAEVRRAIRWFADGLAADLRDDQFQCFFFAIEILAEYHKSPAKVPDRCPTCRGELFCRECERVPLHRPYAKQAIEQLLVRLFPGVGEELFKLLDTVRNSTMHGSQIDEIEAELDMSFSEVVNRAGKAAFRCIMKSLRLPPGRHQLAMATADTFIRPHLVATVHAAMESTRGDPLNPRLEELPRIEISMTRPAPDGGKQEPGK